MDVVKSPQGLSLRQVARRFDHGFRCFDDQVSRPIRFEIAQDVSVFVFCKRGLVAPLRRESGVCPAGSTNAQ